jgi:hypothetical protein
VTGRAGVAVALAAAAVAGAGCGNDKQLPPSNLPVLVPACKGGRGPALSDRAADVTLHAFPGRSVRVSAPPPSLDLRRAAVTVTKRMLCVTAKTAAATPRKLELTARRSDDDEQESFWTVSLAAHGPPEYSKPDDSTPAPVAGAQVRRRGALLEFAVPLSAVGDAPFDGDFEWQLTTRRDVLGPDGRPPPAGEHVDCLTRSNAWARFPQGTRVRRHLPPGGLGPGCAP